MSLSSCYSDVTLADFTQLRQTTLVHFASKYLNPTLAVALPDWHILLGTRELLFDLLN